LYIKKIMKYCTLKNNEFLYIKSNEILYIKKSMKYCTLKNNEILYIKK
jgi:hypothetical protein